MRKLELFTARRLCAGAFSAFILVSAANASADAPHCGSSPPSWNVPNGGLFLVRSKTSPVKDGLTNAGLYWTHSALSNGTWVTQAEFDFNKASIQNDCAHPIDPTSLQNGAPGAQQVTFGGFYTDNFSQGWDDMAWKSGNNPADDWAFDVDSANPWIFVPGNSDRGAQTADFFWNVLPYTKSWSDTDSGQFFYSLNWLDNPNQHISYKLSQYMSIGLAGRRSKTVTEWRGVPTGPVRGDLPPPQQVTTTYMPSNAGGVVCSTLIAYGLYQATSSWINPGAHNVSHDQAVAGMNGLYSSIYNMCKSKTGWAKRVLGYGFLLGCASDPCSDVANQVLNCFSSGVCGTTDPQWWHAARDAASVVPVTVSPDCLAGRGGHCFNTAGGSSAWAWDSDRPVNVSGDGSTYGCWE